MAPTKWKSDPSASSQKKDKNENKKGKKEACGEQGEKERGLTMNYAPYLKTKHALGTSCGARSSMDFVGRDVMLSPFLLRVLKRVKERTGQFSYLGFVVSLLCWMYVVGE